MKKLITVIAILALLLGGGAWLAIHHHDRDDAQRDRGTSDAMSRLTTFTTATTPRAQKLPILFAQVGAAPRRVAGHVASKPVPTRRARRDSRRDRMG